MTEQQRIEEILRESSVYGFREELIKLAEFNFATLAGTPFLPKDEYPRAKIYEENFKTLMIRKGYEKDL